MSKLFFIFSEMKLILFFFLSLCEGAVYMSPPQDNCIIQADESENARELCPLAFGCDVGGSLGYVEAIVEK